MSGAHAYVLGQVFEPTSQPTPQPSSSEVRAQTLALMDLFNATGGASWTNSGNWSLASEVCSSSPWYGVTCDGAGNVTALRLDGNNLVGHLPSSIGNLTALVSLDLASNHLRGPIPSSLGALSGLQNVSLATNQLTGPIPSTFGDVQQAALRYLDARSNQLNGMLPSALGSLSSLEVVLLTNNSLSGR
jgi:Leucine-rich repeat (LRR) protein